jgi:hypothetical protein
MGVHRPVEIVHSSVAKHFAFLNTKKNARKDDAANNTARQMLTSFHFSKILSSCFAGLQQLGGHLIEPGAIY